MKKYHLKLVMLVSLIACTVPLYIQTAEERELLAYIPTIGERYEDEDGERVIVIDVFAEEGRIFIEYGNQRYTALILLDEWIQRNYPRVLEPIQTY